MKINTWEDLPKYWQNISKTGGDCILAKKGNLSMQFIENYPIDLILLVCYQHFTDSDLHKIINKFQDTFYQQLIFNKCIEHQNMSEYFIRYIGNWLYYIPLHKIISNQNVSKAYIDDYIHTWCLFKKFNDDRCKKEYERLTEMTKTKKYNKVLNYKLNNVYKYKFKGWTE